MRTIKYFISILFLLTPLFLFNLNAGAQQLVCPMRAIQQITDYPRFSTNPSISGDGTRIAFQSNADINGGNPDNNEEIYLANTLTNNIIQITNTTGFMIESSNPSINTNGTRIAFASRANINGGNPGMLNQLFLFDTTTGTFTQITNVMSGSSNFPSISGDGTRIAFTSSGNINGGNLDGSIEIYYFDTTTGIITQITDEPTGFGTGPSISGDGTRIAFATTANINGGNPGMLSQTYLYDIATGIITQITFDNTFFSVTPSINADGTRIAFSSSANINGLNPENKREIYIFDTTAFVFSLIKNEGDGGGLSPSINADGMLIAFETEVDNPGNKRDIALFDTTSSRLILITDEDEFNAFSFKPSINASGTRIAFYSRANINGGNPDGTEEIFLANCFDPATARNIPTLSEWGMLAMVGILGIVGLLTIRRRKVTA